MLERRAHFVLQVSEYGADRILPLRFAFKGQDLFNSGRGNRWIKVAGRSGKMEVLPARTSNWQAVKTVECSKSNSVEEMAHISARSNRPTQPDLKAIFCATRRYYDEFRGSLAKA